MLCVLLVVLAGCGKKPAGDSKKGAARQLTPVVVAQVVQRDIPVEVRAIGNVEAYSTIQLKAEVSGELQKVHFKEGQAVTKGQLLFEVDPRPAQEAIRQLEANLAKDSATAANAKADASRYGELFKQGIVARQQFEQVTATAQALEAALDADRAAITNAQLQLHYTQVYSPINGRTGNLMIKEGNLVKANDLPLVTINEVQPIYVTFSVPERELPEIRRRVDSGLHVTAVLPDDSKSSGVLTFIDNSVDQTTGTIKMKGTFENADKRLWPGQFVNVILTVAREPHAIVIPAQAVQAGQQGQYVYVIGSDNKAQFRSVDIGRAAGTELAIRSGLAPGETVIIDGQSRITPGAGVQIVKAQAGAPAQ